MAKATGLVESFLGTVATQYGFDLADASLSCRWCRFRVSLGKVVSLSRRLGLPRTALFVGAGIAAHTVFCRRVGGN